MHPGTRYAKVGSDYVGYQVMGEGPLDLVFIPSWSSNIDIMWEQPSLVRFLRRLASFARLICFDKRGTGISDPVSLAALPTLEQWADDVLAVMDDAGSARAALLGHAEGAPMAMLFAASHPERTSALVLMEAFARFRRDVDYPAGIPADRATTFLEHYEARWGTGANVDQIAPSLADDARFRQWYGRYERVSIGRRASTAIYGSVVFGTDLRPLLPTIHVPTLVLHRRGNRHIRIEHGRYLAAQIPGAAYVEVAGDDHLFYAGDVERLVDETEEFLTGTRPAPDSDRVFATIVFSDIVRSTERAAELGDRQWREVLDAHDALVRCELERYRGHLVQTTGDGALATFDGPARAIRWANAIARRVREIGIDVRAGLHAGEVESRGADIGGIAVHIAARVMDNAGPGEVVVSSTVKDLVAGSGLAFADRGTHVLRGVPGEWRLHAVQQSS